MSDDCMCCSIQEPELEGKKKQFKEVEHSDRPRKLTKKIKPVSGYGSNANLHFYFHLIDIVVVFVYKRNCYKIILKLRNWCSACYDHREM